MSKGGPLLRSTVIAMPEGIASYKRRSTTIEYLRGGGMNSLDDTTRNDVWMRIEQDTGRIALDRDELLALLDLVAIGGRPRMET